MTESDIFNISIIIHTSMKPFLLINETINYHSLSEYLPVKKGPLDKSATISTDKAAYFH